MTFEEWWEKYKKLYALEFKNQGDVRAGWYANLEYGSEKTPTSSLQFPDCSNCKVRFNGCATRCGTPTCNKKAVQKFDDEPETTNIRGEL